MFEFIPHKDKGKGYLDLTEEQIGRLTQGMSRPVWNRWQGSRIEAIRWNWPSLRTMTRRRSWKEKHIAIGESSRMGTMPNGMIVSTRKIVKDNYRINYADISYLDGADADGHQRFLP